MPRLRHLRAGRALACALVLTAVPAATLVRAADVFINATMRLPLGDDTRLFLNITQKQYAVPEPQATTLLQRCRRPEDDYPTVMFLAGASSLRPEVILDLRLRGLAWVDVMSRLRIEPAPLFAGLDRDPGPPYGHAWGSWKKHPGHGPGAPLALSDVQVVDLAKLQIASRACGVSPYDVAMDRRHGYTVEQVVGRRTRSGGEAHTGEGKHHGGNPEHGQGENHGHGHDHGNGHGHNESFP